MSKKYWLREDEMDFLNYGPRPGWEHVSEEEVEKRIKKYAGEYPRQYEGFMDKLRAEGRAWLGTKGWERYQAQVERPESAWRSNPIRQRKSPYFYVRKGSGFVLLDNHEETSTHYKTEAEAKKAVLALNDAWRAKHAPRANPGPMMYSIMRAQEEARKKAKRNPEGDVSLTLWARPKGQTDALYEQPIYTVGRTMEDIERVKKLAAKDGWHTFRVQRIDLSKPFDAQAAFTGGVRGSRRRNPAPVVAYIKQYGAWYSANERQWASLVAAGVSGKVWNLRHLATPLKSRPTSRKSTAIPVIEPIDFVTPERWLEADAEVRRMQTVLARPRSRRNPAPTRAEIVERADISIENGMGSETMTALEDILDGYDGDNIRARFYVGWRDSDLQALLDELGTRNVRRRNPRKYDESRDDAGFRKVSDLKKGEFFKRKPDARKVYRKGDYDRAERKYECGDTDDISRAIYLKGDALVYVGFDY